MAFEVIVPQMGESVLEGTIVEWKVAEGDRVKVNQPLVEIMTDKVNVEIPSEVEGVVEKILAQPNEVVKVGSRLCTIATAGDAAAPSAPKKKEIKVTRQPDTSAAPVSPKPDAVKTAAMPPAIRKLARDFGLDPESITGTGPDGRITREDVQKAAARRSVVAGAESPAPASPAKASPSMAAAETMEERIPLIGARKSIAEHMVRSKHISPHVTTFEDCDFTELVAFRKSIKEDFLKSHGVALTYMPFIMKATVEALKEFPTVNASLTDTEIILKKYYHLGVAVARENGLIVPVVKNTDRKTIVDLAVELHDLSERARADKLQLADVQGGTFTLTNAGMFGATASTPIINQPQVAILGIHKIAEKPVVREGQIVIRQISTLGLSFDHRLVDGHIAVQFLHRLIQCLEAPPLLLMSLC